MVHESLRAAGRDLQSHSGTGWVRLCCCLLLGTQTKRVTSLERGGSVAVRSRRCWGNREGQLVCGWGGGQRWPRKPSSLHAGRWLIIEEAAVAAGEGVALSAARALSEQFFLSVRWNRLKVTWGARLRGWERVLRSNPVSWGPQQVPATPSIVPDPPLTSLTADTRSVCCRHLPPLLLVESPIFLFPKSQELGSTHLVTLPASILPYKMWSLQNSRWKDLEPSEQLLGPVRRGKSWVWRELRAGASSTMVRGKLLWL